MGVWIENLEKLQPLADLVGNYAKMAEVFDQSENLSSEAKFQMLMKAQKVADDVQAQLEEYGVGKSS